MPPVRQKVLIVDDSLTIVEMLKVMIQRRAFEVITANNGESGLKIAQLEKPDVIILDIMLPKMDGFNVCRKIKGDPELAGCKVVLFTVRSDAESKEMGAAVGADDFITKDTDPMKVIQAVMQCLEK
jgi:DNA-binding response OmpR family regulator